MQMNIRNRMLGFAYSFLPGQSFNSFLFKFLHSVNSVQEAGQIMFLSCTAVYL